MKNQRPTIRWRISSSRRSLLLLRNRSASKLSRANAFIKSVPLIESVSAITDASAPWCSAV